MTHHEIATKLFSLQFFFQQKEEESVILEERPGCSAKEWSLQVKQTCFINWTSKYELVYFISCSNSCSESKKLSGKQTRPPKFKTRSLFLFLFRQVFRLPSIEKLDGNVPCTLWTPYNKTHVNGVLYLSRNYMCFASRVRKFGLNFHLWEGKAIFILQRALPLENLKGHQGQNKVKGGCDLLVILGLQHFRMFVCLFRWSRELGKLPQGIYTPSWQQPISLSHTLV